MSQPTSVDNRIRRRHIQSALMLGGPAALGLFMFLVLPFIMAIGLTFSDQRMLSPNETKFVGLRNYDRLLSVSFLTQEALPQTSPDGPLNFKRIRDITRTDPEYRGYRPLESFTFGTTRYVILAKDPIFIKSLINTIIFMIFVVPLQLAAALGMALLINQKIKGRNFFRTVYFAPVVMSMVVVAIVWAFLFNTDVGLLNQFLNTISFGLIGPVDWLGDPDIALYSIILMSAWQGAGFQMIIFLAGLQGISQDLYEAASIDGANAWQKFVNVTLPGLKNTMIFVVISTSSAAFALFTQVDVMTKGGPADSTSTVMFHAIRKGFHEQDIAYGSTISVIYFIIIASIALTQKRLFQGERK